MAAAAYHAPTTPLSYASPPVSTAACPHPSGNIIHRLHPARFGAAEESRSLSAATGRQRPVLYPWRRGRRESAYWSGGRIACMRSGTASLVTAATWEGSILCNELPVVVEFFAAWCGPCRMVDRLIDEIAEEYAGRVGCFKLNADHFPQLAVDHGVERVPTVLIFKDGQRLESITGTMPKSVYTGAIEKILALRTS